MLQFSSFARKLNDYYKIKITMGVKKKAGLMIMRCGLDLGLGPDNILFNKPFKAKPN